MKPDAWKQIDELIESARRLPPESRAGFLRDACAGDETLRTEVDSLLTHLEEAGSFLETPPSELAADLLTRNTARLNEGQIIDQYEIASRIGSGGMGEVYLARDRRLNRTVALKVLSRRIAIETGYQKRFEEEARLASNLSHPNIVTIYGVGQESDIAYIAMEFVRGKTLREILSDGPMPVRKALDIAGQIAEALTAAHACGVVHRDLKPENVMVTAEGLVKVLDFGLARRQRFFGDHPEHSIVATLVSMSGEGMILGTVGYMSPEQASGKVAGPAADYFSLGTILYEMLTGHRAFERETAVETLSAIIREQPAAIRLRESEVAAPLRQLLERCLAKDPADRYADTQELARHLRYIRDRWVTDENTPIATASRAFPSVTRRRALGLSAAALLAAAVAWRVWPATPEIHSLVVLPFANVDQNENSNFLSETLRDGLIAILRTVPALTVKRGSGSPVLDADPHAIGLVFGVDAVLVGSFYERSGTTFIEASLIDVNTAKRWSYSYEQRKLDLHQVQDQIATSITTDAMHLKLSADERRRLSLHFSS